MLGAYCPTHGCEVLVPISEVDAMERDANGFSIHFTCQCGYRGWQRLPRTKLT